MLIDLSRLKSNSKTCFRVGLKRVNQKRARFFRLVFQISQKREQGRKILACPKSVLDRPTCNLWFVRVCLTLGVFECF